MIEKEVVVACLKVRESLHSHSGNYEYYCFVEYEAV